jgi:two-component system response regulator BaeR
MMVANPRRLLVVEDDPKIARLLVDYFAGDGFDVLAIGDGQAALRHIEESIPSLIVLDLMLPGLDGMSLCRAVRRFSDVPIIMVTARVDEVDRLLGLDIGADDYVCKPFSPREVVARARALLRRVDGLVSPASQEWHVDEVGHRIRWQAHWLPLTPVEFRILRLVLTRPGRVFSRAQLLDSIHQDMRDVSDRAIDSHVKNLRRKIQAVNPNFENIVSVYGVGYRFDGELCA